MKIEAKPNTPSTLNDLKGGDTFWYTNQLYMKLSGQSPPLSVNVVNLYNGMCMKWTIDGPRIAKVKIVNDE